MLFLKGYKMKIFLTLAGYEQEVSQETLDDLVPLFIRNNFSFSVAFRKGT